MYVNICNICKHVYVNMCSMCMYMNMCKGAPGSQKRAMDPLESFYLM